MSAAATLAGAAPDAAPGWHAINWQKVWRTVRRLQARIVKAVQEGRWGKVQALVYLLTHSFSGRAAAILRVTTNAGASTPGVDGDVWNTPELKAAAFQQTPPPRLSTPAVAAGLHPEKQRPIEVASPGHSDLDRPRHAGAVPAGPGPDRGNDGGCQFLRLSQRALLCRCPGTMSQDPAAQRTALAGSSKATSKRASIGSAMTGC